MGASVAAVICAAGSSRRMGGVKKEYLPLKPGLGEQKPLTVLYAAVSEFSVCSEIGPIVVTLPPNYADKENAVLSGLMEELRLIDPQRIMFVEGGPTRRVSVHNALSHLEQYNPSYVLIHDGARPWIKKSLIENVISAVIKYGAVIPALPLTETPKELYSSLETNDLPASAAGNFIKRHLRRAELCLAQTPQGFKFGEILFAHEKAAEKEKQGHAEYTDDAELWGEFIGEVAVIPGDPENRKITYPEDLGRIN